MERLLGDRWFYCPSKESFANPADFNLAHESVFFPSGSAKLHGWFFPAETEPKGTVVHCHGNGGNVSGHFQYVAWMPSHGWNVLCFDYQGFGRSEGRPGRPATIADANAALDYVKSRDDVDKTRLLMFGQSLGGTVAIVTAAGRDDLRGVAVEGAFSDYRRAAHFVCRQSILLWGAAPLVSRLLIARGYDAIDYIDRITPASTFFITGTADRICDYRQTVELHEAAPSPKSLWVIDGGQHIDAITGTDGEGPRRLDSFFSTCVDRQPAALSTSV